MVGTGWRFEGWRVKIERMRGVREKREQKTTSENQTNVTSKIENMKMLLSSPSQRLVVLHTTTEKLILLIAFLAFMFKLQQKKNLNEGLANR